MPEAQRTQGIESITWIMFLTEINFILFWRKKIIQVTDSIPWVRCASGNVYILYFQGSISTYMCVLSVNFPRRVNSQPHVSWLSWVKFQKLTYHWRVNSRVMIGGWIPELSCRDTTGVLSICHVILTLCGVFHVDLTIETEEKS